MAFPRPIRRRVAPGDGLFTVDDQVDASANDSKENEGTGVNNITTSGASLSSHGADPNQREWSGLRWAIAIPSGATITVAYVEVRTSGNDDANGTIYFEDAAGPPVFTTGASNISNRTRTTQGVSWVQDSVGANQFVQSPSIVDIIQELADSFTTSALAWIAVPNQDVAKVLHIWTWDWDTSWAAKIHIEYTT